MRKGLVIVNTGNGKGKTTAALGVLFRASGSGMNVAVIQFIKHATGNWGEIKAAKKLQNLIITGRDAPPELIAFADLVTEMRESKHPYTQGIKAQPGVEF